MALDCCPEPSSATLGETGRRPTFHAGGAFLTCAGLVARAPALYGREHKARRHCVCDTSLRAIIAQSRQGLHTRTHEP